MGTNKAAQVKYLQENEILMNDHHRGQKYHSTITAKPLIDYYASKVVEKDKICFILSTDLSAIDDTVDHKILLYKLQYYRLEEKYLNLLKHI